MLGLLAQVTTDYTYTYTSTELDKGAWTAFVAFLAAYVVFVLVLAVFYIVCWWKIFEKAGVEGWKAIIPIYNMWKFCEIAGKPGWWIFLMFIPIVNFIVSIILMVELAKSFGKDTVFALLLIFVSFIAYPMLAFGSAEYVGPGGKKASA